MFKSSILNLRGYQTYLKSSLRYYWSLVFVVLPAIVFAVLSLFEYEIAALIMRLYPASASQGLVYYLDLVKLAATEVLWIGFFFLVACVLMVYPSRAALDGIMNFGVKRNDHLIVLVLSLFFMTTLFVGLNTLERFPGSSDEYAYLFQAEMFSDGRLWAPAHDLPDFFRQDNIAQHEGILVSRFPPGWPVFLSASFEVGIPAYVINPVLGLLTLIVFYFFARYLYGDQVALWSLIALAFTGYFVFNSASFYSHVLCLLVTLLFMCNLYLYHQNRSFLYGLLAGFFLGFIAITRYYNALIVFVPVAVSIVYQYRLRSVYLFFLMAVGAMPFLIFLASYNYSITGDALLPVTAWAFQEETQGFVKGHSFFNGIEHLIRWILLFFYWCSPGLLVLYFVFLFRKVRSRAERLVSVEDYFLLSLMLGYLFSFQAGGNQYGPRFLFEGFPFLVLFVISKVLKFREKWAVAFLIASVIFAVVKFPFIVHREEWIVNERRDLYNLVEKEKISNAVVLVSSSTSPTRPMPTGDLIRNDRKFQNDVIFALDLPRITGQLMNYYGDRSFYRYVRNPEDVGGHLIKIK